MGEVELRVDGVGATFRHRDAVDVVVRESTGRMRELRQFRDAVARHRLREKMLPSPTKFHYTFTLKDLSRLFQGVLRTPKSTYTSDHVLVQLWRHEAERVFSDKLVNLQDKDRFRRELDLVSKQLTGAVVKGSEAVWKSTSVFANAP